MIQLILSLCISFRQNLQSHHTASVRKVYSQKVKKQEKLFYERCIMKILRAVQDLY